MGTFINIGNAGFVSARNGEYIDKSGLIGVINRTLNSQRRYICVTRSRRFGKSMAAWMLNAYYDCSCDSRHLFEDLEIAKDATFEQHLNKFPVLYLDMMAFVTRFHEDIIVSHIESALKSDVIESYPDVVVKDDDDLMSCLIRIAAATKQQFFFIIDEWDAICREYPAGSVAIDRYVNWLRRMFKEVNANNVFAGVYMTGILPIKKYKTESALNNFWEYSMVEPRNMDRYFGFTKDEVKGLAERMGANFDELKKWYDGYHIGDQLSMFNPNSVIQAVYSGRCRSYWASTGAYVAVADYINMNFDHLKDDVILMLAGGRCHVDPTGFQNDMSIIKTRDDVLTVLIHLGYLSYDWQTGECYIPNREVEGEMVNAIKANNWSHVVNGIEQSRQLLRSTLDGDEEAVALGLEAVHDDNIRILSYNDENSLALVLTLAYYTAKSDNVIHRELPTGKGFADVVFMPRKNVSLPAIIFELKYDESPQAAIDQIKDKDYIKKVLEDSDNILLVGISYDKKSKRHECKIEVYK